MGNTSRFSRHGVRISTATAALIALTTLFGCSGADEPRKAGVAQTSEGAISGAVSADQGDVIGFRVKARDTVNRITYTVYTQAGRYNFLRLPPSQYEVQVLQEGFKSNVVPVDLKAGEAKTADVQLSAEPPPPSDIEIIEEYDTLYPPEPGRAVLEMECMGCHGKRFFNARAFPLEVWRAMIAKMTMPGGPLDGMPARGDLSEEKKEIIAQYLTKHFGPDSKRRDLRMDELVVDEAAVAGAMFIEYDLPDVPADAPMSTFAAMTGRSMRALHDPGVAPDGRIWFSDSGGNSVLGLDPRVLDYQKRYENHLVSSETFGLVHGVLVDNKGVVYWNEINNGVIGWYDPATKKSMRIEPPYDGGGHSLALDSKGDVWNTVNFGSVLSKLDTSENKIVHWETPSPYSGLYGIIVDPQDNVWSTGLAKHMILKFDPATEKFTEYRTPHQPSGPRRLQMDSKGQVWFTEYSTNALGVLDPKTGEMKHYTMPLRYTGSYGLGIDKDDNLWISDTTRFPGAQWMPRTYNTLIKFDPRTEKFTYFPLPSLRTDIPHMVTDKEGTLWFGGRVAIAFKPNGNVSADST